MNFDEPLLSIQDLSVTFRHGDVTRYAVDHISFDIAKGKTLALVGESGSGKSVSALSILRLLSYPRAQHPSGKIMYSDHDLLSCDEKTLRKTRGGDISMIFQEPMTSLNPLHNVERQIGENLQLHQRFNKQTTRKKVLKLLDKVGILEPEKRLGSFPFQLSGGQRQRVMIAMAIANNPALLIADEPTTALDVSVQAQILELLAQLKSKCDMSMLFITHDLDIVKKIADRVCIMSKGQIVESGTMEQVFENPQHDYTRHLLSSKPGIMTPRSFSQSPELVRGQGIKVWFPVKKGFFRRTVDHIKAVDGVDIHIRRGETVGVVGESGSGKTTLALALIRMIRSKGTIVFAGKQIEALNFKKMQPLRQQIQIVIQDPFGSLSPRMSVDQIIGEGLSVHSPSLSKIEREQRVISAMEEVNLDPDCRFRYPHEFSGGQRQRISLARAIVLRPNFLILDEPTSALDVSIQVQMIALLKKLQKEHKLTYLFISHDLRVVRALADRILVMCHGKTVEFSSAKEIFEKPKAAYTKALLAAAFQLQATLSDQLDSC